MGAKKLKIEILTVNLLIIFMLLRIQNTVYFRLSSYEIIIRKATSLLKGKVY